MATGETEDGAAVRHAFAEGIRAAADCVECGRYVDGGRIGGDPPDAIARALRMLAERVEGGASLSDLMPASGALHSVQPTSKGV